MIKHVILAFFVMIPLGHLMAQNFITRGKITFEVKQNNRLLAWESTEEEEEEDEDEASPQFNIYQRELIFSGNRLIYLPGKGIAGTDDEYASEEILFTDLNRSQVVLKTEYMGDSYIIADSIRTVKWKIGNETRKIAGWDCRKAIGKIFDSVYVVAFYCSGIIPQGGPEFFSGLPGMILGLAIPRYHTTWFATKVEIANIDDEKIVAPTIKNNKSYSRKELAALLYRKYLRSGTWKGVTLERVEIMLSKCVL